MDRLEVLQGILNKKTDSTYLEIGVAGGEVFFAITARKKLAIDPRFRFKFTKRIKWLKKIRGYFKKGSKSIPYRLTDQNMETELRTRIKRRYDKHGHASFMSQEQERQYVETKIIRNRIATYFTCLFSALLEDGPMPVIDISQGSLSERVTRASQVLNEVVKL